MANLVAQFQLSAYTTPTNGTTADANQVRGNFNTTVAGYNSHDADPTIHVQQSVNASRPAAGAVHGLWYSTDTNQLNYDSGGSWVLVGANFSGGNVPNVTVFLAGAATDGHLAGWPTGIQFVTNLTRQAGAFGLILASTAVNNDVQFFNDGSGSFQLQMASGSVIYRFTQAGSLTIPNGCTVTAGGLTITAGGLTVSAGGAVVTGGVNIVSGNLTVANGTTSLTGNTTVNPPSGGGNGLFTVTSSGNGSTATINIQPSGSPSTGSYQIGGTQVVGARIAGWGTSTNGSRGAINGSTATLPQVAAALAQLLIDLGPVGINSHGLLGA